MYKPPRPTPSLSLQATAGNPSLGVLQPFSTMVSHRVLLLSASFCLLVVLGSSKEPIMERSPENDASKTQEEKELIAALQEVLEKLKNKQLPTTEKKLGWLPECDTGEQCAVRKGSRVGKLCGCPRGTVCNFSVLQCL